jgi:hypothetical protein
VMMVMRDICRRDVQRYAKRLGRRRGTAVTT